MGQFMFLNILMFNYIFLFLIFLKENLKIKFIFMGMSHFLYQKLIFQTKMILAYFQKFHLKLIFKFPIYQFLVL